MVLAALGLVVPVKFSPVLRVKVTPGIFMTKPSSLPTSIDQVPAGMLRPAVARRANSSRLAAVELVAAVTPLGKSRSPEYDPRLPKLTAVRLTRVSERTVNAPA